VLGSPLRVHRPSEAEALTVAERRLAAVGEPFPVGDGCAISASIGVTIPGDGDQPEDVLRDADTAMYRAKSEEVTTGACNDPAPAWRP
jgi:GGDEF domain-containing protein